jgi:hypothetical protein
LQISAIGFASLAFAVLVLFAGYFIGRSGGFYDAEANGYSRQYQAATEQRVSDCFRQRQPPSAAANCVEKAIDASHEEQRAEHNLDAQRQMADWAWWLLIVTALQTPITLVGIVLLLRNIQQADAANEISRQAMTAENRAWIEIEILSLGDLRYVEENFRLTVKFRFRNIGKSVALNVVPEATLIGEPTIGERTIGETSTELDQILRRLKGRPSKLMAQNLFPGRESPEQEWDTTVKADDVQLVAGDHKSELYPLCLVLGVQYNTIFDGPEDGGHQTIQLGYLRKLDDRGRPGLTVVGRNPILAEFLRLIQPYENLGVVT